MSSKEVFMRRAIACAKKAGVMGEVPVGAVVVKDGVVIAADKDGNIIEQGNHKDLLAKDGFYANLYNSQFAR